VNQGPIGIFDSGVGGVAFLKKLTEALPNESFVYVADTAYFPYGLLSPDMIQRRVFSILDFFQKEKAKAVLFACFTASSSAYDVLQEWSSIPLFEVIEVSTKAALKKSVNRKIGVIATERSVQSGVFLEKMSQGTCVQVASARLVSLIEDRIFEGPLVEKAIENALEPIRKAHCDTLLLGCTHFSWVTPLFREILKGEMEIIDPVYDVTKKMCRTFPRTYRKNGGQRLCFVTGDPGCFDKEQSYFSHPPIKLSL